MNESEKKKEEITQFLKSKSSEEIIQVYAEAIKELKEREVIRTNNVIGEMGEYLAISHYRNTAGLSNLSPAPVGTENYDAISRKGDRYSIKSTSTSTTGVFYGLEPKGSDKQDEQKFDYVIICKFDGNYELEMILEIDWDTFIKNKRWHSRMNAWNLIVTKKLYEQSKVIYQRASGD